MPKPTITVRTEGHLFLAFCHDCRTSYYDYGHREIKAWVKNHQCKTEEK